MMFHIPFFSLFYLNYDTLCRLHCTSILTFQINFNHTSQGQIFKKLSGQSKIYVIVKIFRTRKDDINLLGYLIVIDFERTLK